MPNAWDAPLLRHGLLLVLLAFLVGCTPLVAPPTAGTNPDQANDQRQPTATALVDKDDLKGREEMMPKSTPSGVGTQPPEPAPVATGTRNITTSSQRQALEDLAARLQVNLDEITVVRAQEVDWPDGSVGCPQPGMRYKQVLTNGTFIQLQVGDQLYNYHGGVGRPPFLCTSPNEVVPEE